MKTIIVSGYPATFYFRVKKELPTFTYACEVRQKILLRQFKNQNVYSPCHGYDEYVIFAIEKFGNEVEVWHLES